MRKNLKISFVLFVLLGLSALVTAQTEKGNLLVSGSSSLEFTALSVKVENSQTSHDAGKTSTLEFKTGVGYFIANNLALGLQFSLSSSTENDDGDKYTQSTSMLFPFARLYLGKSNIKPFVQAAFGPGWQKWNYDNDKETQNLFGYEVSGGLAFFVRENISLDFALGYASASADIDDWKSTARGFGGNIGFSIIF